MVLLERELRFFESKKRELLSLYQGQFAVIKGERLVGTYTTFQEAFEAGVKEFGTAPFLIRQVVEKEQVLQYPALSVGMIDARS